MPKHPLDNVSRPPIRVLVSLIIHLEERCPLSGLARGITWQDIRRNARANSSTISFRDTTMGIFDRLGNLLEGKGKLDTLRYWRRPGRRSTGWRLADVEPS